MSDYSWLRKAPFERIKPYFPLSHGVPRVEGVVGHAELRQESGLPNVDGYAVMAERMLPFAETLISHLAQP